jgi:hypothetical protein
MRLICESKPPRQDFGDFVLAHCPPSLSARLRSSCYSSWVTVWAGRSLFAPKIARIYTHTMELFDPKYLSDFEDLARTYESMGGPEVSIHFHDEAK